MLIGMYPWLFVIPAFMVIGDVPAVDFAVKEIRIKVPVDDTPSGPRMTS